MCETSCKNSERLLRKWQKTLGDTFFCRTLSCTLFMYMHNFIFSYKRDAMGKLKISNGGATDVYLSNSRCVRNNDQPVDNMVFTGRLPVSAGPQHHQWQQHQQLLMQADDCSSQFFADSGHSA